MRSTLSLFLFATVALGAVDGTVINRTTNRPQPGATVTLYRLGGAGMDSVETVRSDAQGRFRIEESPRGPCLIQTAHDGVTYNIMLPQGSPTTGLTVEVFDSSSKPGNAKVAQHMVLLEPTENRLFVSETVIFQNDGKLAYNDPDHGTLKIFLPDAVEGQARVMATAPNGMPVQRAAEKTDQPNVYKIDFPIKPGETRFDVSYVFPFPVPGTFAGRVLHKDAPLRLVAPAGVSVTGPGLESLGTEPHTQAAIFGVKGQEYKVEIQGTGRLSVADAGEEEAGPSIQQILPRVYDRVYWIVGLSLAILMLGFILLYRSTTSAPSTHPPAATRRQGTRR